MKKRTILAFCALLVFGMLSISVSAQVNTHSVWTNLNGLYITDATNGCQYTNFGSFNMATSWNEPFSSPNPADAHFRGVGKAAGFSFFCPTRFYDFRLVVPTATATDQIDGKWDIYRNNVLVCSTCAGTAYGLNGAVGAGYKLYVDDPIAGPQTWLYAGVIDQRKDF